MNHYSIQVLHDKKEHVWVAYCDALGLVTEASTYDELTASCWSLVPKLIDMNNISANLTLLQLKFENTETANQNLVTG